MPLSRERIAGPLGTERGWSHVIEQHPYRCARCDGTIEPGRMMVRQGQYRHAGCHVRAQFESMSLPEQEEMLQRIRDVAFGEEEPCPNAEHHQFRVNGERCKWCGYTAAAQAIEKERET
jgi:hypothetical protein